MWDVVLLTRLFDHAIVLPVVRRYQQVILIVAVPLNSNIPDDMYQIHMMHRALYRPIDVLYVRAGLRSRIFQLLEFSNVRVYAVPCNTTEDSPS
jgi:hypothetical protein